MAKKPSLATWAPHPDDARTYGLVGEFMSHWSSLEYVLSEAVQKLAGLSAIDGFAVTANMGVRDKIHTVKTLLNLYGATDATVAAENAKLLEKITDRSGDRNLVAHTAFTPHKKGVQFLVIKAKGDFNVPNTVWTLEDFRRKNTEMTALANRLRRAVTAAQNRKIAVAMTPQRPKNILATIAEISSPNALYRPAIPLQLAPDFPEATSETEPQRHQAPQPKPKGSDRKKR